MKLLVLGLSLLLLLGLVCSQVQTKTSNSISNSTLSPSNSTPSPSNSSNSTNSPPMTGGMPGNANYMVGATTKSGQSHMLASASLLLASLCLHTLWQ